MSSRWYEKRQHRRKVGSKYSFFEKGETVHEAFFNVLSKKTVTEVAELRDIERADIYTWKAKGFHLLYYQSLVDLETQEDLKRRRHCVAMAYELKFSIKTIKRLTAFF